jgi:hypothetical protein
LFLFVGDIRVARELPGAQPRHSPAYGGGFIPAKTARRGPRSAKEPMARSENSNSEPKAEPPRQARRREGGSVTHSQVQRKSHLEQRARSGPTYKGKSGSGTWSEEWARN